MEQGFAREDVAEQSERQRDRAEGDRDHLDDTDEQENRDQSDPKEACQAALGREGVLDKADIPTSASVIHSQTSMNTTAIASVMFRSAVAGRSSGVKCAACSSAPCSACSPSLAAAWPSAAASPRWAASSAPGLQPGRRMLGMLSATGIKSQKALSLTESDRANPREQAEPVRHQYENENRREQRKRFRSHFFADDPLDLAVEEFDQKFDEILRTRRDALHIFRRLAAKIQDRDRHDRRKKTELVSQPSSLISGSAVMDTSARRGGKRNSELSCDLLHQID